MSLVTYEQARPWARAIKTAVVSKQMPPWFADPGYAHLANERRLVDREIDTLVAWADTAAPAGDPATAPPPLTFDERLEHQARRHRGDAEAIRRPRARHRQLQVHRRGHQLRRGHVGDRRRNAPGRSCRAASREGLGAAARIEVDGEEPCRARRTSPRATATSWAGTPSRKATTSSASSIPGSGAQRFDIGGSAKFVPKGSDLVFELHYTTSGKPAPDISKLGLVLAKEPPQTRYFFHAGPTALNLAIPPGDGKAEVVSEITFGENATAGLRAAAHASARQGFRAARRQRRGQTTTVLKGNWNFEWQMGYQFAEPIALPKGSKLQLVSHFDNSTANRFNPDPAKKVVWGPQNWDEMSNCFIGVLFDRSTAPEKVFLRSGPSLLPRGEAGPTLEALEPRRSECRGARRPTATSTRTSHRPAMVAPRTSTADSFCLFPTAIGSCAIAWSAGESLPCGSPSRPTT